MTIRRSQKNTGWTSDLADWRDNFPYNKPREFQEQLLDLLAENWHKYKTFVIVAPTAFGKTPSAKTLLNTLRDVSYIQPNNMLVSQTLREFPDTPSLHRLDSYECKDLQQTCLQTKKYTGGFCKGCQCGKDQSVAKFRRGPGVYNYHIFASHRLHRKNLVVDEAHNLVPWLQARFAKTIWKHDVKYPSQSIPAIQSWLKTLPKSRLKEGSKLGLLNESLNSPAPKYVVQLTYEEFNGKGTKRGEPEERPCIKLLPVEVSEQPPVFWNRQTEKIVLLSATINKWDVAELGLDTAGVCYLQCPSPIPPKNRPVVRDYVASVSYQNLEASTIKIANHIQNQLLLEHPGEKGIVHATYAQIEILRKHLTDDRFLFHDRNNKREVYEAFRRAPASSGKVLVAAGMYEGIDLPDDLGRWQAVAKVPWKSLGSPAIKYKAEQNPDWYMWQTLKDLIQACGRIARHENDFGVTYLLDGSAEKLLRAVHLIPSWFQDCIDDNWFD